MTTKRKKRLIWRWSLVTVAGIALFWAVWHLVAGQVPVTTSLKMTPDWTIILPFGISRWWDVLIGPIWATILVLLFTNKRIIEKEDLFAGLVAGLVAGLGAGLAFGLAFGLVDGLVAGLVVGLAFGLGFGLDTDMVFGLVVGLAFGLGFGLGAGLVASLVAGLGAGLVVGLAFGLVAGLVVGLGFGLARLVQNLKPGIKKAWEWLLATESR